MSRSLVIGNLRRYCRDLALIPKTVGRDSEGGDAEMFLEDLEQVCLVRSTDGIPLDFRRTSGFQNHHVGTPVPGAGLGRCVCGVCHSF